MPGALGLLSPAGHAFEVPEFKFEICDMVFAYRELTMLGALCPLHPADHD